MGIDSASLAVVGGSGFDDYPELNCLDSFELDTPFGRAAPITLGELGGKALLFMPRHGPEHKVPPHLINYRANIWALREQGAGRVLAVNAVGGIRADFGPGRLVIPDQLIDYTYGRDHTFFTGAGAGVAHVEFDQPYDEAWRNTLLAIARRNGWDVGEGGVLACTQGPRLETAAEIRRLKNDGCDLVGMTGMPEAVLARELGLAYASLAVVVNWAGGLSAQPITLETVFQQLRTSIIDVKRFIALLLASL
ncbi:S-methyl-5'-thioinosine phosphorylase [Proteobacteria bacterium 005FR1]|nr:S-methyl-5'-thioinosine phosphorylase [Proteobacteria bacterium 005FR1]